MASPPTYPSAVVRFYFDFVSPYSFLGWTQVGDIARRHGRVLEPVPVLFAGLLDAHGHKGPAEIPAKRRYVFKDVVRKAHRLGIGVAPPPAHPFNPLLALRIASLPIGRPPMNDAATRERIIDTLFWTVWTKQQAIDSVDAITSVLSTAGLSRGDAQGRGAGGARRKVMKAACRFHQRNCVAPW